MLLDYGADIEVVNSDGETALHLAIKNSAHPNVLEFILSLGFNIERGDNKDYSALHCAVYSENYEAWRVTLETWRNCH